MPTLIRPDNCSKCKFRLIEEDGTKRCHRFPPQVIKYMMPKQVPGPQGMQVQMALAMEIFFPEVMDHFYCFEYKARVLNPNMPEQLGGSSLPSG
jgi:hypothetical protein